MDGRDWLQTQRGLTEYGPEVAVGVNKRGLPTLWAMLLIWVWIWQEYSKDDSGYGIVEGAATEGQERGEDGTEPR